MSIKTAINPAGKVVSRLVSKFTIVNDPKNKVTAKQIEMQQKRINNSLRKEVLLKGKIKGLTKTAPKSLKRFKSDLAARVIVTKSLGKELENMNDLMKENNGLYKSGTKDLVFYTAALTGLSKVLLTGLKLNMDYIENLNIINRLFGSNTDQILN